MCQQIETRCAETVRLSHPLERSAQALKLLVFPVGLAVGHCSLAVGTRGTTSLVSVTRLARTGLGWVVVATAARVMARVSARAGGRGEVRLILSIPIHVVPIANETSIVKRHVDVDRKADGRSFCNHESAQQWRVNDET